MAQSTTYDIIGIKEDISSIISNISPTEYPFTTMTGAETCKQTLFQWQEDKIRDAAANAQVEGADPTAVARTPTTMRDNVTQIFMDTFQVAGTTDAVSTYGRSKETAYQAALAAEGLKKDYEYACVGTAQAVNKPSDNTTARKFAGVQAQIDTSAVVKTGAAATKITEANLLSALQTCYSSGAKPNTIMVCPSRSLTIADFAKASGRTRQIPNGSKDRAIVNVVDLYVS